MDATSDIRPRRRGPKLPELALTAQERTTLERWARRRTSSQALAERCRIVLACAQGRSNTEVAQHLGVARSTVIKWRSRFVARRLEGLVDKPRPGAPRTITDEQVERVIVTTLETTPTDATHWSTRSLARALGMNQTAVSRIGRAFGLKPHLTEAFKLSTDPQFIDKVRDIVGRYLNPPQAALVLCVDDKTQVQALDRTTLVTASSSRGCTWASRTVMARSLGSRGRTARRPTGCAGRPTATSACSSPARMPPSSTTSTPNGSSGSGGPTSSRRRRPAQRPNHADLARSGDMHCWSRASAQMDLQIQDPCLSARSSDQPMVAGRGRPTSQGRRGDEPMALIRRHPLTFAERDPFGLWIQDWPEVFRSFRSLLAEDQLRVEEFMDGDTLVIRTELPGIDPDKDVELTVGDGMLHIHAERRQEKKVEDKDLVRSELRYGAFTRTLPLPVGATDKDIDASYKAGILEVRVPVDRQKAAATKIPVRTT